MVRLGLVVWILAIAIAGAVLYRHATTSGNSDASPSTWPVESALVRATERPTIVVFAHPECPCTRATFTELDAALAAMPARPAVIVVAFDHEGDLADRIPAGARLVVDRDGAERARFGVHTSGHVMSFDANGALRFSGGITGSRGHVGDNVSRRQLVAAIGATAPIYGCAFDGDAR